MLLRAMVAFIIFTALFETLAFVGSGLAIGARHAQALSASTRALDDAQAVLLATFASGVQPTVVPTIAPSCLVAQAGTAQCALHIRASITALPLVLGDAQRIQSNDNADELRRSFSLSASATDSSGAILATRTRLITVRELKSAPYVSLVGARDITTTAFTKGVGDDAASRNVDTTVERVVHVLYRNAQNGASLPGDVWTRSTAAPQTAPPWSAQ